MNSVGIFHSDLHGKEKVISAYIRTVESTGDTSNKMISPHIFRYFLPSSICVCGGDYHKFEHICMDILVNVETRD